MLVTMSLGLCVDGQGQSSCNERDDGQAVWEELVLHDWPAKCCQQIMGPRRPPRAKARGGKSDLRAKRETLLIFKR